MKKSQAKKLVIVVSIGVLVAAFFKFNLGQFLTLEYLKEQREYFQDFYAQHQTQTIAIYMVIYIISTALSLPGATILTLAGGAIFGAGLGTVIVSFASTIGATSAFWVSRTLLRDTVQAKFGDKLRAINEGMQKEGGFYLFTLRLIPLFPFFMINLLLGLTPITMRQFFFISQVGMLPGTFVYVNAGTQLSQLESLQGILSPQLIFSFALLGIFPVFAKHFVNLLKARKAYRGIKAPKNCDYNLVVIGGGAAGLVSAYIAAAVKAKVALIEKHRMGGDCLNTGCVPSKALIQSAKMLSYAKRAKEFGFNSAAVDFNFARVMERVTSVIKKIEPHDSVERYTGLGVECIQGTATLTSPFNVAVNGRNLTTKNIVIASGAEPLVPPLAGLDQVTYYTTDTIWELRELPQKLLVLGGGPIGCELAQCFARFGSSVTQVEKEPRLLTREDSEISDFVLRQFKKENMQVMTGTSAKAFVREGGKNFALLESKGQTQKVEFDAMLLALGRKPRVQGFGLEALGIELNPQKTIAVNEFMQTKYPNIYVCGDVAGPYQFTHTASHQAWYSAVNALFSPFVKYKADYRVIPWCTFTDPEVARVGLNELEAKEKNIPYEVTTYGIDDLDRAIADGEDHGVVKVLTVPGKDKILGATIVGAHAGDLICEYVTAMKYNLGLNKILGTIHIYPTMAEANKYAAGNWKKAHAPGKILDFVKKYHAWRRS